MFRLVSVIQNRVFAGQYSVLHHMVGVAAVLPSLCLLQCPRFLLSPLAACSYLPVAHIQPVSYDPARPLPLGGRGGARVRGGRLSWQKQTGGPL